MVRQTFFQPVQGCEQLVEGFLVGLLRPGESTAVHTVVDVGEDTLHHLVHLLAQSRRVEIRRIWRVELRPLSREVERDLGVVVGDDLSGTLLDDRWHRDSAGITGKTLFVGVLQSWDVQNWIDAARIQVEGPGVGVVGWATDTHGECVAKAKQLAHDDGAVRPRAGASDHEPVATGLCEVLTLGRRRGNDPVGDVVPVTRELLALAGVDA